MFVCLFVMKRGEERESEGEMNVELEETRLQSHALSLIRRFGFAVL